MVGWIFDLISSPECFVISVVRDVHIGIIFMRFGELWWTHVSFVVLFRWTFSWIFISRLGPRVTNSLRHSCSQVGVGRASHTCRVAFENVKFCFVWLVVCLIPCAWLLPFACLLLMFLCFLLGSFFPGAPPSLFCLLLLTRPTMKRSISSIILQLDVFWRIIGTELHCSHKEASCWRLSRVSTMGTSTRSRKSREWLQ